MTASFEGGLEELAHNLTSGIVIDETTGHHQHVGIVMLTDHMGNLSTPCQTGTDGLVLVQTHGHALTGTTDGDTGIDLTFLNTCCELMGEVGIVYRLVTPCTVVFVFVTVLFQPHEHIFLQRIACMVAGNANSFNFHNFTIL